MKSNDKLANAIKNLTAVIIGIAIIPPMWAQLEKKNAPDPDMAPMNAAIERLDAANAEVDRVQAKRAAEALAAQDAPQPIAVVAEAKSLDRSEPTITEMLAVFDDAQLDTIAENAAKYSNNVSPAELVAYFKPEFKSMVHDLVFQARDQSSTPDFRTQIDRANNAIDRAVAKKHI